MNDGASANAKKISVLGFVLANRQTVLPSTGRGATQTPVAYEDFTLDGVSLYELLFIEHDPDTVTCFSAVWPEGAVRAAEELLGECKSELDDGRIALYVCPECFDLGCRALTIEIERSDEFVIWKNFGWQNNYEDGWEVGDYEHLTMFEPIVFERKQYEDVLRIARDRYVVMPRSKFLSKQGDSMIRRFFQRLGW